MADNVRTWTGISAVQAQAFVAKAQASGFEVVGEIGTDEVLTARGHGFNFMIQYHEDKEEATITIVMKPFFVSDNTIFATLNGFIIAAQNGNHESMHNVWAGVAKPFAHTNFKIRKEPLEFVELLLEAAHFKHSSPSSYDVQDVAKLYQFPTDVDGTGQTVGIVELGGGYTVADLQRAGVDPSKVTAVSVDGAQNSPGSDADGEVELDIQVVAKIAPGASIRVYFAPNTDGGFAAAVAAAKADSVGTISWGGPEDQWTESARREMDAALAEGPVWFVASGDNNADDGSDKAVTDYPASSPNVIGCGGTTLSSQWGKITSEVAWNHDGGGSGGGVSAIYPVPEYQKGLTFTMKTPAATKPLTGRGVPDVAGNADPSSGYKIVIDGQWQVIGGTSAVAPLWAGLLALLQHKAGKKLPNLKADLYDLSVAQKVQALRDVTYGDNVVYKSTAGWDAVCGLGSPGSGLEALLPQLAK